MNKKRIIFDVGANDGRDSVHLANNPNNVIYAFEPTPRLIGIIKEKIKSRQNYILTEKAVSNFTGKATFNIAGQADWGCSSLLKFSEKSQTKWPGRVDFQVTEEIEVDVIQLKDFIEEYNIEQIDFLHVDTQGSDLNVLIGMGVHINKVISGVIEAGTEENILYDKQNTLDECTEFLTKNGFKIDAVQKNDVFNNEVNIKFSKI